jgi:hypothetical protein
MIGGFARSLVVGHSDGHLPEQYGRNGLRSTPRICSSLLSKHGEKAFEWSLPLPLGEGCSKSESPSSVATDGENLAAITGTRKSELSITMSGN